MDIARRVPELVHSHELRSHIDKVKQDNGLTQGVNYFYGAVVQNFYSCPDATAEHDVSAETQRVTAGTPGTQHDDHGLRLAGGRERYS